MEPHTAIAGPSSHVQALTTPCSGKDACPARVAEGRSKTSTELLLLKRPASMLSLTSKPMQ